MAADNPSLFSGYISNWSLSAPVAPFQHGQAIAMPQPQAPISPPISAWDNVHMTSPPPVRPHSISPVNSPQARAPSVLSPRVDQSFGAASSAAASASGIGSADPAVASTPFLSPNTSTPFLLPTASALFAPPTTSAPYVPPTASAPFIPPTASAPFIPPTASAQYIPPTASAPFISPTASAQFIPPTASAPFTPPNSSTPYVTPPPQREAGTCVYAATPPRSSQPATASVDKVQQLSHVTQQICNLLQPLTEACKAASS